MAGSDRGQWAIVGESGPPAAAEEPFETQAALHESIERAKELVCEARQVMLRHREEPAESAGAEPPNPAV